VGDGKRPYARGGGIEEKIREEKRVKSKESGAKS